MYNTVDSTLLEAILAIIVLIAFFMMASRLGDIKKNTEYLKSYFKAKAKSEGMLKTIECTNPNCKHENDYFEKPPERCSKCNTALPKV